MEEAFLNWDVGVLWVLNVQYLDLAEAVEIFWFRKRIFWILILLFCVRHFKFGDFDFKFGFGDPKTLSVNFVWIIFKTVSWKVLRKSWSLWKILIKTTIPQKRPLISNYYFVLGSILGLWSPKAYFFQPDSVRWNQISNILYPMFGKINSRTLISSYLQSRLCCFNLRCLG